MEILNYHHLRYFWEVAREGNLTRAARRLHVSQSALSTQIKRLELELGLALFSRDHKSLVLTEAGHTAMEYAETIFRAGAELQQQLKFGSPGRRRVVRIGAMATLSRNFQSDFLRPLFEANDVDVVIRSGGMRDLMEQLNSHLLDLVLSNIPVRRDAGSAWHCHLVAEQPVSMVARREPHNRRLSLAACLNKYPVQLPSLDSHLRHEFDRVVERAGLRPVVAAEIDDMAMLRLVAQRSGVATLVPPVVVQDELKSRTLVEICRLPEIRETFYATLPVRRRIDPLIAGLVSGPNTT